MPAFQLDVIQLAQREFDDLRAKHPEKFRQAKLQLKKLQSETGNVAYMELLQTKHIKKLHGTDVYFEFCWPNHAKGGVVRVIFKRTKGTVLRILIADLKKSGPGDPYPALIKLAKKRDRDT